MAHWAPALQGLIIDESRKMVPDTKNRLEQTADELRSLIVSLRSAIVQCLWVDRVPLGSLASPKTTKIPKCKRLEKLWLWSKRDRPTSRPLGRRWLHTGEGDTLTM